MVVVLFVAITISYSRLAVSYDDETISTGWISKRFEN